MKVQAIWVYPIKSLRGVSLPSATLTPRGILYDRRFMLLRDHTDNPNPPKGEIYQNMHVSSFPEMCLFHTELTIDEDGEITAGDGTSNQSRGGYVTVTHRSAPEVSSSDDGGCGDGGDQETTAATKPAESSIRIPVFPTSADLDGEFDMVMHSSPMRCQRMGAEYSDWFSARFGFAVILAYVGSGSRPVLGNLAPNAAAVNPQQVRSQRNPDGSSASWLTTLSDVAAAFASGGRGANETDDYRLSFADCSAFLVVSAESCRDVSKQLPGDAEMDITKCRPNIVIEGAENAWDEDYWAQLTFAPARERSAEATGAEDPAPAATKLQLELTANCLRCQSLNIDYTTGTFHTDPAGTVLKALQRYRRVDKGHPYSPVFGRYGFMLARAPPARLAVGDHMHVSRASQARSVFKWPGLGRTAKTDIWAL